MDDGLKELVEMSKKGTPYENRLRMTYDIAQVLGFLAKERSFLISRQAMSALGGTFMYQKPQPNLSWNTGKCYFM
jgi:hypothetical protein